MVVLVFLEVWSLTPIPKATVTTLPFGLSGPEPLNSEVFM